MTKAFERPTGAAAIIPAYNEQATVHFAIEAALRSDLIDRIVVVDDGSSDQTYEVANQTLHSERNEGLEKPFYISRHETNMGKAEAMHTGVHRAKNIGDCALKAVIFIDADSSPVWSRQTYNRKIGSKLVVTDTAENELREIEFTKLFSEYLDELLEPVLDGKQIMTIGMYHRNAIIDWLRQKLNWGALAGNRALNIDLWYAMESYFQQKERVPTGWQMEAAMNSYTRLERDTDGVKLNRKIGKLLMPEVVNIGSRVKTGSLTRGILRMAQIHSQAIAGFAKYGVRS